MADKSIAIIGAGVFGVSTALAWRRKYPTASVYLIDVKSRTPESAGQKRIIPASEDTAKIIRAAYASPEYADLAREALGLWQSESIYAKFFHKSGWVVPHTDEVRRTSTAAPISRERFEELYPEANIDTGCEITEDKEVGWVEASKCLEAVLETAIGKGVIYCSGEATELLWNGPRCVGVKLRDGQEINSESVVLATGCWTPKFLEQCHIPGVPCEVAGVTAVGIRLGEEEYERHKEMPILIIPARG
jgi:glycine/D-amino acid oxidase-like deaminating enzyme